MRQSILSQNLDLISEFLRGMKESICNLSHTEKMLLITIRKEKKKKKKKEAWVLGNVWKLGKKGERKEED